MKDKEHLPLYGVGPVIVIPQGVLTAIGIIMSMCGVLDYGRINILKIPFIVIGIILIVSGVYMWYCANYKSKVFDNIVENRLVTSGIYSVVRNPIYSSALMACTGAVFIVGNVFLFVIPFVCWIYMTIFLKNTEEKMLKTVKFWLFSYHERYFVRFAVIDKSVNKAVGTVELFRRDSEDKFDGDGVLRLDVKSDYEKENILFDILSVIVPPAFEMFDCTEIITKVPVYAVERIKAVQKFGFSKSEYFMVGTHDGYAYKDYWTLHINN